MKLYIKGHQWCWF